MGWQVVGEGSLVTILPEIDGSLFVDFEARSVVSDNCRADSYLPNSIWANDHVIGRPGRHSSPEGWAIDGTLPHKEVESNPVGGLSDRLGGCERDSNGREKPEPGGKSTQLSRQGRDSHCCDGSCFRGHPKVRGRVDKSSTTTRVLLRATRGQ
jgi:hypothetical protein